MRNERGMTIAAFVVVLCCFSGTTNTFASNHSNVIVSSVIVDACPCSLEEHVSDSLEAPEQTTSCCKQTDVKQQLEIEVLQNLPPPTK